MAVVIEYAVLPDGSVRPGELYPARVRNRAEARLRGGREWLEGTGEIPATVRDTPGLEDQLRLQLEAMKRLRRHRHEQGALELDTVEAEPLIEDGVVRDLVVQRQNLARCLIEEFMVAANGTMVAYLERAGLPMLQRVVRVPRVPGTGSWRLRPSTAKLCPRTPTRRPSPRSCSDGGRPTPTGSPTSP